MPDNDIQHYCHFCKQWFHLHCLLGNSEEFNILQKKRVWEKFRKIFPGTSKSILKYGMSLIIHGSKTQYGVAGNICHVYDAFQNFKATKVTKLPFPISRDTPDFHIWHIYKCMHCMDGYV